MASQALRRVAGDVRGLSALEGTRLRQGQLLAQRAGQIAAKERNLQQIQKMRAGTDRESIRLSQQKARLLEKEMAAQNGLAAATKAQTTAAKKARMAMTPAQLRAAQSEYNAATKAIESHTSTLKKMPAAYSAVGAAQQAQLAKQAKLIQSNRLIDSSVGTMTQQLKGLREEARQHKWANFEKGAGVMRHVGRIMMWTGVVGAAALGGMSKMAADFQTQIGLTATQTGKAGETIQQTMKNSEQLQKAVLVQMQKFPASSKEMSDSLYEFFSSTTQGKKGAISLADGIKLLTVANKASVAGQAPLKDSTTVMISLMNHFGIATNKIGKEMDHVFAAVRFGKMHFSEMAKSLETIGPAALAANQHLHPMVDTFAFLTTRIGPAFARVGIARLLEAFGRPDMIKGLQKFGVNIKNAKNELLPLPEIIQKVVKRFPELAKGGIAAQNFIKRMTAAGSGGKGQAGFIQARRALAILTRNSDDYLATLGKIDKDHGEFQKSLEVMGKTAGVQWGTFVNRLKSFAITIGASVLPIIGQLGGYLSKAANWFNNLDDGTKKSIAQFAAFTAIGLTVVGVLGMIAGSIAGIVGFIGRLKGFAGIAAVFLAIGAAVKILTGDLTSLGAVAESVGNMFLGSWQGVLLTAGLVTAAFLKMRGAAATAAASGAEGAAAGGFVPALIGSPGRIKAGISAMRTAGREATAVGGRFARMRGVTAGLMKGMAILPAPIKIFAGALGLAGLAAGIFSSRMAAIHAQMEKAKGAAATLTKVIVPQRMFAIQFAQAGTAIQNFVSNRDKLAATIIQIRELKKSLTKMEPGPQRQMAAIQLRELQITASQTKDAVRLSYREMAKDAQAFGNAVQRQTFLRSDRGQLVKELNTAKAAFRSWQKTFYASGGQMGATQVDQARGRIKSLTGAIRELDHQQSLTTRQLASGFRRYVRSLQGLQILPQRLPANFARDAIRISTALKRALKPTELKQLIKLELNRGDLSKVNAQLAAAFRKVQKQRIQVQIATDVGRGKKIDPEKLLGLGRGPLKVKKSVILDVVPSARKKKIDPGKFFDVGPFKLGGAVKDLTKGLQPSKKASQVNINLNVVPKPGQVKANIDAAFAPPAKQKVQMEAGAALSEAQSIHQSLQGVFTPISQIVSVSVNRTVTTTGGGGGVHPAGGMLIPHLPGSSPFRDSVPALLTPGEMVLNKGQQDALGGTERLSKMFGFARGGIVQRFQGGGIAAQSYQGGGPVGRGGILSVKEYETLGRKIIQAEMKGIKSMMPQLEHLGALTVELFAGKIMGGREDIEKASIELFQGLFFQTEKMQKKMEKASFVPSVSQMRKDLATQVRELRSFNSGLAVLARRGAPQTLLNQLRSLGVDGAKFIKQLAHSSRRELRAYVNEWKKASKEIEKSGAPKLKVSTLIKDMKSQRMQVQQFNKAMATLVKRKLPLELLAQLQQMGLEGTQYLMMLAGASKKQVARFIAEWKKLQAALKKTDMIDPEALKQRMSDALEGAESLWRDIASRMGENFGQLFAGGVIAGVQEMQANVASAIAGLLPSMGEGILGEMFPMGSAEYAQQLHDYNETLYGYQQQRQDLLSQQNDEDKSAAQEAADDIAKINADGAKRIMDIQKQLSKDLLSNEKDRAKQISDAQYQLAQETLRNMKSAMGSLFEGLQDDAPDVQQTLEDIKSSFGSLFQGIYLQSQDVQIRLDWGQVLHMDDLLKDLQSQVDAFKTWQSNLRTLIARNVPAELIKQLQELGPEAASNIQILTSSTDAELKQYVDLWKQTQQDIQDATDEPVVNWTTALDMGGLQAALQKQVNTFEEWHSSLQALAGKNVPQEFVNQLAQLGPEALPQLRLLVGATDSQLQDYVALWQRSQQDVLTAAQGATQAVLGPAASANDQIVALWTTSANRITEVSKGIVTDMFGLADEANAQFTQIEADAAQRIVDLNADAAEQIAQVNEDVATSLAEAGQKISDAADKAATDLGQVAHDLAEVNYQIAQLGNPPAPLTFDTLFAHLQDQVLGFEALTADIVNIKNRLLDQKFSNEDVRAFIGALADMGPQGAAMIKLLATASEPELKKYVDMWKRGQLDIQAAQKATEIALSPEEILKDLRGQSEAFQEWQNTLTGIKDRNVPAELLKQLEMLGPEAEPMLKALLNMTDAQLAEYVNLWKKGGKQVETATKDSFDNQIKAWKEIGANITQALIDGLTPLLQTIVDYLTGVVHDSVGKPVKDTAGNPKWWEGLIDANNSAVVGIRNSLDGASPIIRTNVQNWMENGVGVAISNTIGNQFWWINHIGQVDVDLTGHVNFHVPDVDSNINVGNIGGFAGGTNYAPGGLAIVGEEGPELVNLRRGTQVIPNDAIGNEQHNHFNIEVNATEGETLDDSIAKMLFRLKNTKF